VVEPWLVMMNGNHVEIDQGDVVEPTPVAQQAVVVTDASERTSEIAVTPTKDGLSRPTQHPGPISKHSR
jgi:hypothetical protein